MLPPHVKGFYKKAEENYEGFWEDAAVKASSDIYWFNRWTKLRLSLPHF
jgi:hypothetical protein